MRIEKYSTLIIRHEKAQNSTACQRPTYHPPTTRLPERIGGHGEKRWAGKDFNINELQKMLFCFPRNNFYIEYYPKCSRYFLRLSTGSCAKDTMDFFEPFCG